MERTKQFEILFTNNHNCVFYPGQLLQGHVIIETHAPIMIKGIQLLYTGRLIIAWTEQAPGTAHRRVDIKEFTASEDYFSAQQILSEKGVIYPGKVHSFEFEYKLPLQLPESYEDDICYTEYYLEARLKYEDNEHVKHDLMSRADFFVSNPLDLNTVVIPDIRSPSEQYASQTFGRCCCVSPPITASLHIRHTGYTPGQKIRLYGEIENYTGKTIEKAYVTLIKQRLYYTPKKKRTETDELARVVKGPITPHSCTRLDGVALVIPSEEECYNVDASQIFVINYYLEMVIEPKGAKKTVVPPIQIILGKLPLERKIKTAPATDSLNIHKQMGIEQDKAKREPEKSARVRRKERERKVTPLSELTDTSDYVAKPPSRKLSENISGKLSEKMIQSSNWTAI